MELSYFKMDYFYSEKKGKNDLFFLWLFLLLTIWAELSTDTFDPPTLNTKNQLCWDSESCKKHLREKKICNIKKTHRYF